MRRNIILLIVMSCLSFTEGMAQNMKDIVRTMPDSIIPLLSLNNRLDFVDYIDSKMKAEVTNQLGGKSEMTTLTDDFAHIRVSACSTVELKVLPLKDSSYVVAVVWSVVANDKYTDSQLTFYSPDWATLPRKRFLKFEDKEHFCAMTFKPHSWSLNISFSDPFQLDKNVKEPEPKTFEWKDDKFE